MQHSLLSNPGLLSRVRHAMQFERFSQLTNEALATVRLYLQQNLDHSWSSLGHAVRHLPTTRCVCLRKQYNRRKGDMTPRVVNICSYAQWEWLRDLRTLLQPYHDAMLRIAYRKPDAGLLSFLLGKDVREKAPLVPRPRTAEELAAEASKPMLDVEEEEKELDRAFDMLNKKLGPMPSNARSHNHKARYDHWVGHLVSKEAEAKRTRDVDARVSANVYAYLCQDQFRYLFLCTEPSAEGVVLRLPEVVEKFSECGVEPDVIDSILTLLEFQRTSAITKKERLQRVIQLRKQQPHAYNLLQIAAELLKRLQSKRGCVVGRFSVEVKEEQIRAVEARGIAILQADDRLRLAACDRAIRNQMRTLKDRMLHSQRCKLLKEATCRCLLDVTQPRAMTAEERARAEARLAETRAARVLFENRLQAIERSFQEHPVVEEASVNLFLCRVCGHVYSNVRDSRSMFRRFYRFGLREAVRHHENNALYCSKNRSVGEQD